MIQYDPPLTWLIMEANSTNPVTVKALILSPIHSSTTSYMKNVMVKTSLKIQFKHHFGLQMFSVHAPLAAKHVSPPSPSDSVFLRWNTWYQ